MDLSKNTNTQTVRNESSDINERYILVNFDQNSDNEEEGDNEERYEILLLPDRSQQTFIQNTSRLSPPLVPQNQPLINTVFDTDINDCITGSDHCIDASVSPTRIALSNIQEFVETTVVLRKDKKNELGISIVGGNDTYLVSIPIPLTIINQIYAHFSDKIFFK